MSLFSRRTSAARPERELSATERLARPAWRAELERVGLGGVEPVFAANNDGATIAREGRRFSVTAEVGVVVVTTGKFAFLYRMGERIVSTVAEPREITGLGSYEGSLELCVRGDAWQLAGDPAAWGDLFEQIGLLLPDS